MGVQVLVHVDHDHHFDHVDHNGDHDHHFDHVDDDGEVIMIIMLIMIMLAMNLSDKMMGNSMIVLNLCSLITDQAL